MDTGWMSLFLDQCHTFAPKILKSYGGKMLHNSSAPHYVFQMDFIKSEKKSWVHGNKCTWTVPFWKPFFVFKILNRANCSARANYLCAAITNTTNTEKSKRTQAVSHRKCNHQAQINKTRSNSSPLFDVKWKCHYHLKFLEVGPILTQHSKMV